MGYDEFEEIPSKFVRFDTTMTAQGEFVNVRDMQVLTDNHNYLVAKGTRRNLFTYSTPTTDEYAGLGDTYGRCGSIYDINMLRGKMLVECQCLVSHNALLLTCVTTGYSSDLTYGIIPNIYFHAWEPTCPRPVQEYTQTSTFSSSVGGVRAKGALTSSGRTTYSFRIWVPPLSTYSSIMGNYRLINCGLFIDSGLSSHTYGALTTGFTATSASERTLTVSTGDSYLTAASEFAALVCTNSNDIEPRQIISGGTNTIVVDKPFTRPIRTGADTFTVYTCVTYKPARMTVFEEPVTDFYLKRPHKV